MMTKTVISICLVILSLFSVGLTEVFATASLSLSPGKTNPAQGQSFSVSVNINTGGEAVNAAEVTLTFPADKLKATSISGGSFDVNAESTIGSGIVRIGKGKLPPAIVGSARVASVNFTALSVGSATISGSGSVLRESDSANILGTGASTVINIGVPAAAVTAPSGQTTTPQQPGAHVETPAVAPAISDIEVMNLGVGTATIKWKTDKKAASYVEYGFAPNRQDADYKYMFDASSEKLVGDHEINLASKTLVPGYLYHFRVMSVSSDDASGTSEDATFLLPGYPLTVNVQDVDGKAVSGAKVKLTNIGLEGITDETGKFEFNDLPTGNILILVEYKNQTKQDQVQNLPDKNEKTVVLDQKTAGFSFAWLLFTIVMVILFLIVVRKWKRRVKTDSTPPTL